MEIGREFFEKGKEKLQPSGQRKKKENLFQQVRKRDDFANAFSFPSQIQELQEKFFHGFRMCFKEKRMI